MDQRWTRPRPVRRWRVSSFQRPAAAAIRPPPPPRQRRPKPPPLPDADYESDDFVDEDGVSILQAFEPSTDEETDDDDDDDDAFVVRGMTSDDDDDDDE